VGYVLFSRSKISAEDPLSLIVFFAGIAGISIMASKNFVNKEKA
jgi:hypothetical protein